MVDGEKCTRYDVRSTIELARIAVAPPPISGGGWEGVAGAGGELKTTEKLNTSVTYQTHNRRHPDFGRGLFATRSKAAGLL